eukprot:scaffold20635_cov78-Skeletonema_dohrnii-CCMP3373.AAC.1
MTKPDQNNKTSRRKAEEKQSTFLNSLIHPCLMIIGNTVYLSSQGEVPSNRLFDRLPKRVWDSLTKEEQQIWDNLSPATKSIIINCRLQSPTPIRPITHRRGPSKTNFCHEDRNNPNSAGRNPQSPIAQAASINAIEKLQDVDVVEALQDVDTHRVANLAAITDQLDMPTDEWTDEQWNDDLLINSLRRDDAIDVNQTSQLPPFSMERFLSQPDSRVSKPGENNEDVLEARRHTEIGETDADCADDNDDGGSSVVSNLWSGIRDANHILCLSALRRNTLALVDRGVNDGVGGGNDDVRLISTIPNSSIDIQGMDNHILQSIPLGSVGGVAQTQRGKNYSFGNQVSDTAVAFGGQQRILTPSGYSLPLDISNGLACLRTRPFTDDEWNRLPRVEMTSNEHWNPRVHDANAMDDPDWHVNQADEPLPNELDFNALGEYIQRISAPIAGVAISDRVSNAGIAGRSIVPLDLPSSKTSSFFTSLPSLLTCQKSLRGSNPSGPEEAAPVELLPPSYQPRPCLQQLFPLFEKAVANTKSYLKRFDKGKAKKKQAAKAAGDSRLFLHLPYHLENPPVSKLQARSRDCISNPPREPLLQELKNLD